MKKDNQGKRQMGTWFLFAIVIPVIATASIILFILNIAGVDIKGFIKDKADATPGITHLVDSNEEKVSVQEQQEQANQTIKQQKETIASLENEILSLESIIEQLELDLKKLTKKQDLQQMDANQTDLDPATKQMATSFQKMDATKAAGIVEELDPSTATDLLILLKGKVRGDILAEMEPKQAAELMESMLGR